MDTRKPLIAGNWKMNKTGPEAAATAAELVRRVAGVTAVEVMIAPPFTALAAVADALAGSPVVLGAQNIHWEPAGAYTGEVSASMVKAAGCRHVIIGHSERRQFFGETDRTVSRKLAAALEADLVPVLCVGETEQERDAGQTFPVLDKQLDEGLQGFADTALANLIVAYEPVWAIGTGKTATREQAQEAHAHLRARLEKSFGAGLANRVRILYGGSAKPANIADLMAMPDVDGALVGGASLSAETFSQMVHYQDQK